MDREDIKEIDMGYFDSSTEKKISFRESIEYEPDESDELSEEDFYPPPDNRLIKSKIRNIYGGDTYDGYIEYFYEEYEEDLFDG